ncbi:MAG: DNA-3-methyladenine glycosylase [bacterium]
MPSYYNKLPVEFYLRDCFVVAKELLGKTFVKKENGQYLLGKIVEVEVYTLDDPASHSFGGKKNKNAVMFEGGGKLYVYFTYGMYFCCNVVSGNYNEGTAILIRALEPLLGFDTFAERRFNKKELSDKESRSLLNGPGKICIAYNLNSSFNGISLVDNSVFLAEGIKEESFQIGVSSRIGISKGKELERRFFIKNNLYLSRNDKKQ